MEGPGLAVPLASLMIQPAALEGRGIGRIGKLRRPLVQGQAAEWDRKRGVPCARPCEVALVIGEEEERLRDEAYSWPWKSIGVPGARQGQAPVMARHARGAWPEGERAGRGRRIGDLVVGSWMKVTKAGRGTPADDVPPDAFPASGTSGPGRGSRT
jgi:hypothetical protein